MSSFIYKIFKSRLVIGRQRAIRVPVAIKLDFFIKLFYYKGENIRVKIYTSERAKLSKGSDAKPRVKSSKGHDSRATEGTSRRLDTIGY
jgi:hypothetical protein